MTIEPEALEKLREKHRRWLSRLGIVDKPWLILGSAPSPTIPPDLIGHCARVDVNNAGKTANALGLPPADLTFRKRKKSWEEHPYVRTRGLLWLHTKSIWVMYLKLLAMPQVRYKSLMRATKAEREAIVNVVSGGLPSDIGEVGKVTNGVAALCYALFMGVPSVTLAGFSVTKMGHSYDDKGRIRRQIAEDTFVLRRLRDRGNVFTTELELSEHIGLPFIRDREDIIRNMGGAIGANPAQWKSAQI
ncbi:hypothetical protein GOL45_29380 [Sinorhizobium medicae]|uniref:Putative membrane-anchored protein n=1 Tax=Sinorhizobium medicae (strain WSM419) TaxID=366394 RepID=A6UJG7_SINMW|nr:hypothetical protein [Sinorhizobium medicae]ABR63797.1 putative membrane-anchored protein [Sinorhizobium medicae WSM419]MDX0413396.1 hypothetical protein [Sinorhizobium medicae]MDX0451123.1 hypothetical protein [Sinorhizobium medicae]MDX0456135.1 hypothetical protein [Sinorhizobium medicae]MDX0462631.1 hypothetical protein [Sinorhizobium medicae]